MPYISPNSKEDQNGYLLQFEGIVLKYGVATTISLCTYTPSSLLSWSYIRKYIIFHRVGWRERVRGTANGISNNIAADFGLNVFLIHLPFISGWNITLNTRYTYLSLSS